jgi:hypothetical protein
MKNIKKTIICKGINDYKINRKMTKLYMPKAGDLAVFKVLELGKHLAVQGENGNNCYIFPGDLILAAFGNRYATDQFEGYVPTQYHKEYHILGKGGAIGILASMHTKLEDIGTTNLQLVGYAVDYDNEVINTKFFETERIKFDSKKERPYGIILSLGTAMDSGKTTTAAYLSRGLRAAKKKVAYIKLTGTVYTKDRHFVRDCGAHIAVDFSTYGFPSTYLCSQAELLDLHETLLQNVERSKPDFVVIEIADGLLQRETAMLLQNHHFMSQISAVIFSAAGSLGAISGLQILKRMNIEVFAVSGLFTASPLLIEEVEGVAKQPVLTLETLSSSNVLTLLENKIKAA